jgi:lecithin-cholesterol acyltransferase
MRRLHPLRAFALASIAVIVGLVLVGSAGASPPAKGRSARTPIVLFPAYHFTRLLVRVHDQTVDSACPRSGSFEDFFPNAAPSTTFSQVCRDELMTLSYRPHGAWQERFRDPKGVDVSIEDYGSTASAPFYQPMFDALQAAGWTLDRDVRVAGYDARLTPDLGGFLQRTMRLIEDTYRDNGNQPVHLVGHSNGPIYAQYLLTHTSQAWKDKYIHGFTPIAGNLPGQGSVYPLVFTGLNVQDFSFPSTPENARSSSLMLLSAPSSYMSMGDPRIFDSKEIVVGIGLRSLTPGQLLDASTPFFTRDGDVNQEDLTNDAVGAWSAMRCWHFSLTDNPGVDHFSLPSDTGVLARLIADAQAPRSRCA